MVYITIYYIHSPTKNKQLYYNYSMSDDIVGNMEESHTNHKNDDVKNEKEDDDYGGNSPTQQGM